MLNYAHQRAAQALQNTQFLVLITCGPASVQASRVPCSAAGLRIYLLLPATSDHLFNLEQDSRITLVAEGWEMKGEACIVEAGKERDALDLLQLPGAQWSVLLCVTPDQIQIHLPDGWGSIETIDFSKPERQ